jgi:tetratricopeptide (TPR) repeat protein
MGLFRRDPPAPVTAPAPAAVVKAPPPTPAKTIPAPTIVKPSLTAAAPRPADPPPPAAHKEASSVVAAFASWKQATAAKTSVAGKTETAPADVPPPKREDPVMFVYRAAAKQARGDHDAAIEDLTKAIEIDPTCTTAWAGRALSLEAKGDLAGARRDYAKSIEIELRQEIARLARPL